MKNNLENLELKLLKAIKEDNEKLDKIDAEFKKEFSSFFELLFKNVNLWFKRFVNVGFQLNKLKNPEKNNIEILNSVFIKAVDILAINTEKKEILKNNLNKFFVEKWLNIIDISENFIKNTDLHKDKNFPLLENLEKYWEIDTNDLLKISLQFKETKNFLDSISDLNENKKELIKKNFFLLNNTKSENRIEEFQNDFNQEIRASKNIKIYPKVLKFIWKNYSKLKLKNKIESKKDILKRIFKTIFLKFYRLQDSWIDIYGILKKIDNLNDLDSMISLLLNFFEELKLNPNLTKNYIISDNIDYIEEIWIEAEENKDKILFFEKNKIKASKLLENTEKSITVSELSGLLDEDIDLIGLKFINKNSINPLSGWVLVENNIRSNKDKIEKEGLKKELILEEYFEELKLYFEELEKKKIKLFLDWNYDDLDLINFELLELILKLEKIQNLLWINESWL